MPVRQKEAVASFPGRILRPVAHCVEIGHRENVGDVQRLGDIALALDFTHAQRIAANVVGAVRQLGRVRKRVGRRFHRSDLVSLTQWMSMPPLTSITAPVT